MTLFHANHIEQTQSGLIGELNDDFQLQIEILEPWLIRVAITPSQGLEIDRTWMIAPTDNPPINGRSKLSLQDFSLPQINRTQAGLESETLKLNVEVSPLRLNFEQKINGKWHSLFHDRENGAYQWLDQQKSFRHFQTIDRQERHFGLGDKAGPLDRTRRRYKSLQTDALGYDAELSDPLYKHAPFFISHLNDRPSFGLLYDTYSEISFDFGSEHSNYFNPFRYVDSKECGLVYYLIAGPELKQIVSRLHQLTGMPAIPPRWSMGFAFSAMAHTDAADAPKRILEFAKTMREKSLPISAIHFGSGYCQRDNSRRYVFEWNLKKFNRRDDLFTNLKKLGLHTCANVKPVLLNDHACFDRAEKEGWFVTRKDGGPAIERFWDGAGSQLDFTNQYAAEFWHKGISEQILGVGFDGVWNDNNEAELWDETASINGYGKPMHAMSMRPIHAIQMVRTSYDAMVAIAPNARPYSISRAGPIGIARYGETWSGDNETNWHSLKWNLRQGLSMSLSGFPIVGHDIGGFSGPSPSPELLVRWFQMMALHPRAVMNSWKPDEKLNTNLPYMYDDKVGLVRDALNLRYQFLPLLYSLAFHTHKTGIPIIRPLFFDYSDPECFGDQDGFMVGDNLLICPATEEAQKTHEIFLPDEKVDWIDFHTGKKFSGGQKIAIDASINLLPIFVSSGAILPLANNWELQAPHEVTQYELRLYPASKKGSSQFRLLDDDGISLLQEDAGTELSLNWDEDQVTIKADKPLSVPVKITCPTLGARKLSEEIESIK